MEKVKVIALILLTALILNSCATVHEAELQSQTVEDIDGNIYRTIKKGNQVWMVDNLKTTRFNDGSAIPIAEYGEARELLELAQPGYRWMSFDETRNKYLGALYNWYAVETGKLCPKGWHVPSDKVYLNVFPDPVGSRNVRASYSYNPSSYSYWTSTECSTDQAFTQSVEWKGAHVTMGYLSKHAVLFVRCIKDQ